MKTYISLSVVLLAVFLNCASSSVLYGTPYTARKQQDSGKPKQTNVVQKKSDFPILTFTPDTLMAGVPTNVRINLDISGLPKTVSKSVNRFVVYQVDPFTGQKLGIKFYLKDNGKARSGDRKRRDLIFSHILPFRSDNTFESLSFEAVPVISGVESPDSSLVTRITKAITVFPPPPSMDVPELEHIATVPSLKGLELEVSYVWKSDLNLNSATEFLGDVAGYRCPGNNDLVLFEGEKRDLVNEETAIVELGRALEEGKWKVSTLVKLRAGWGNTKSQEPAEIVVVLRDSVSKEELPDTRLAMPITPGSQKQCAQDVVGVVNVVISDTVYVTLSVM